jgi:cell division protein FtsW
VASRSAARPTLSHLRLVREDELPTRRERGRRRRARRRERRLHRDPMPRTVALMLAAAFLLTGVGLVMVLSASSVSSYQSSGDSFLYLKRQAIYAVIGTVALLFTLRVPYRRWEKWSVPLLAVSGVLLLLALHPGIGSVRGGSSRWIEFGPVTIQPSELAKLAIVVFGAMILTRKWRLLDRPLHVVVPFGIVVAAVCGVIILQRDLGTTTIVAATAFVLVFAAGVRMRYLLSAGLLALLAGWALIMGEGYRKVRFLSFLHPWQDRTDTGYQLIQSLIGLGSGGLFGVGLGASRQKWMYIPNAHTDFIFSILGEELGLLGELVVLAMFVVLLYSGFRIATRVTDTFGRLLATGIVAWLGLQTLVNLGAVTGVLPVTGVPLPFVSFGGSSLIVTLAAVGILANVGRTAAAEQGASERERTMRRERRRARRALRTEQRTTAKERRQSSAPAARRRAASARAVPDSPAKHAKARSGRHVRNRVPEAALLRHPSMTGRGADTAGWAAVHRAEPPRPSAGRRGRSSGTSRGRGAAPPRRQAAGRNERGARR